MTAPKAGARKDRDAEWLREELACFELRGQLRPDTRARLLLIARKLERQSRPLSKRDERDLALGRLVRGMKLETTLRRTWWGKHFDKANGFQKPRTWTTKYNPTVFPEDLFETPEAALRSALKGKQ